MRLRSRRRSLVVWSSSASPAGRVAPTPARLTCGRRIRRWIRIAGLLTVIGLRPRWRPLLAGGVLTVAGLILRNDGLWGAITIAGLWFLVYALLIPSDADADRAELERELAEYSTPAQRRDLEATLDQYPDEVTHELRAILAGQALVARSNGIPGAGRS
jgi:hypothetical protein